MINVLINGASGRMGKKLADLVSKEADMDIAALVDPAADQEGILKSFDDYSGKADVVIDFSFHTSAPELMEYCERTSTPCVVATTGHTDEEKKCIKDASEKVAIFQSANMSLGVAILNKLVKEVSEAFPGSEVEIVEAHHDQKADAPSGTAIMLADSVKEVRPDSEYKYGRSGQCKRTDNEIGIHSLRMGNVTGEHEVIFATPNETIRLKHEAHDRALFADGAISAARFLVGKAPGFYDMKDLLAE